MSILLLVLIAIAFGYVWGWASCRARYKQNAEIDKTLADHDKFMREFEERHPEYRGTQWGKP